MRPCVTIIVYIATIIYMSHGHVCVCMRAFVCVCNHACHLASECNNISSYPILFIHRKGLYFEASQLQAAKLGKN